MKTFKDVYKFPLVPSKFDSWVYDRKGNFVFQFEFEDKEKRKLLLNVINGFETLNNPDLKFAHKDGFIVSNQKQQIILIRGWGNLTGIGAMNLPIKEAKNIQDTFAEFIVERLNFRK